MTASIDELRSRVLGILQGRSPVPATATASAFSAFRPQQVAQARDLSRRFSEIAAAQPGDAGLGAVIDEAQRMIGVELPAIVKYALLIFLTHDTNGARLGVPGLEERHPAAIASMVAAQAASADPLAYFREDILANEHHQHWHLVYLANAQAQPHEKERQGELFLYMHEQMLARYDTERLAAGQDHVIPLDPTKPLAEGYDPHWPGGGYTARPDNASLPNEQAQALHTQTQAFLTAASNGEFDALVNQPGPYRATGPQPALDLLGSTIESHGDGYEQFPGFNVHNDGHVDIAEIGAPHGAVGVMIETATAIRDPIFWRWHRLIDDASFAWQEQQGPRDYSKAPDTSPPIKIREGDVILATATTLTNAGFANFHDEEASETAAQAVFGQAHWDQDFSASAPATNELLTQMATRTWTPTIGAELPGEGQGWPAQDIHYLDMADEFAYIIRLENTASASTQVTVRVFIAATEQASDRRMWIELDKFLRTLNPNEKRVVYRPSSLSSVVRKPALRPPGPPPAEEHSEIFDYCQCGWPYNLLLPRGTSTGMPFKLMVMVTDAGYDKLIDEHDCGGMSFCGVRNRYPDARNMGYPFDRPFANGDALAGVGKLPNVAVRDLTIKTA